MGRQITNQAVVQQLDVLRDAMYRGFYIITSSTPSDTNLTTKRRLKIRF
jgi:hypothetical protein